MKVALLCVLAFFAIANCQWDEDDISSSDSGSTLLYSSNWAGSTSESSSRSVDSRAVYIPANHGNSISLWDDITIKAQGTGSSCLGWDVTSIVILAALRASSPCNGAFLGAELEIWSKGETDVEANVGFDSDRKLLWKSSATDFVNVQQTSFFLRLQDYEGDNSFLANPIHRLTIATPGLMLPCGTFHVKYTVNTVATAYPLLVPGVVANRPAFVLQGNTLAYLTDDVAVAIYGKNHQTSYDYRALWIDGCSGEALVTYLPRESTGAPNGGYYRVVCPRASDSTIRQAYVLSSTTAGTISAATTVASSATTNDVAITSDRESLTVWISNDNGCTVNARFASGSETYVLHQAWACNTGYGLSIAYSWAERAYVVAYSAKEFEEDTYNVYTSVVWENGVVSEWSRLTDYHNSGRRATDPQVVYDDINKRFWVVWVERESDTRHNNVPSVWGHTVSVRGSSVTKGQRFQLTDATIPLNTLTFSQNDKPFYFNILRLRITFVAPSRVMLISFQGDDEYDQKFRLLGQFVSLEGRRLGDYFIMAANDPSKLGNPKADIVAHANVVHSCLPQMITLIVSGETYKRSGVTIKDGRSATGLINSIVNCEEQGEVQWSGQPAAWYEGLEGSYSVQGALGQNLDGAGIVNLLSGKPVFYLSEMIGMCEGCFNGYQPDVEVVSTLSFTSLDYDDKRDISLATESLVSCSGDGIVPRDRELAFRATFTFQVAERLQGQEAYYSGKVKVFAGNFLLTQASESNCMVVDDNTVVLTVDFTLSPEDTGKSRSQLEFFHYASYRIDGTEYVGTAEVAHCAVHQERGTWLGDTRADEWIHDETRFFFHDDHAADGDVPNTDVVRGGSFPGQAFPWVQ